MWEEGAFFWQQEIEVNPQTFLTPSDGLIPENAITTFLVPDPDEDLKAPPFLVPRGDSREEIPFRRCRMERWLDIDENYSCCGWLDCSPTWIMLGSMGLLHGRVSHMIAFHHFHTKILNDLNHHRQPNPFRRKKRRENISDTNPMAEKMSIFYIEFRSVNLVDMLVDMPSMSSRR